MKCDYSNEIFSFQNGEKTKRAMFLIQVTIHHVVLRNFLVPFRFAHYSFVFFAKNLLRRNNSNKIIKFVFTYPFRLMIYVHFTTVSLHQLLVLQSFIRRTSESTSSNVSTVFAFNSMRLSVFAVVRFCLAKFNFHQNCGR